MRFSSEHRAAIITETMKFKADFGERQKVKESGIFFNIYFLKILFNKILKIILV